jgi:hypothetical protein
MIAAIITTRRGLHLQRGPTNSICIITNNDVISVYENHFGFSRDYTFSHVLKQFGSVLQNLSLEGGQLMDDILHKVDLLEVPAQLDGRLSMELWRTSNTNIHVLRHYPYFSNEQSPRTIPINLWTPSSSRDRWNRCSQAINIQKILGENGRGQSNNAAVTQ